MGGAASPCPFPPPPADDDVNVGCGGDGVPILPTRPLTLLLSLEICLRPQISPPTIERRRGHGLYARSRLIVAATACTDAVGRSRSPANPLSETTRFTACRHGRNWDSGTRPRCRRRMGPVVGGLRQENRCRCDARPLPNWTPVFPSSGSPDVPSQTLFRRAGELSD